MVDAFVMKLHGGFVDANLEKRVMIRAPFSHLIGRLLEYPFAYLNNHSGIFCDRDEYGRAD